MDYVGIGEDLKDVSTKDISKIIDYAIKNDGKIGDKNRTDSKLGQKATITQTGNGNIKDAKNIQVKSVKKIATTPTTQPSEK